LNPPIHKYILLLTLLSSNAIGQIVYDTVPSVVEIGGFVPEEMMVFKNYDDLVITSTPMPDIPSHFPHNGTVYVSTVFGKNGKMKDTKIVRSVNPIFDSVAFYKIHNLQGWLPGTLRGKFVDIQATFPIEFENDSIINTDRIAKSFSEQISEEKFKKRKDLFDFIYSDNPNQPIISDYKAFEYYLVNYYSDSCYVYLSEYSWPRLRNAVIIKTNLSSKDDKLILKDHEYKNRLFEIKHPKRVILEKNKEYIAIAFRYLEDENHPVLSIKRIHVSDKSEIVFEFQNYNKLQLINELNKYAP